MKELVGILTYVLVAVILLATVAWMGGMGGASERGEPSRIMVYIKSYSREHKGRLFLGVGIGFMLLLLWLITYI